MRDPDQVQTQLAALLVEQTLNGSHVLARDVLPHDDDARVPSLALTPQLGDDVVVTTVGVAAHDHALVQTGHVTQSLGLIGGVEVLGEVEGFHLNDDIDAPAVGQPVGEVGVVVRGQLQVMAR